MSEKPTFGQLPIAQDTVAQLAAHGITEPTPVQAQAIPAIAAKKSVIFQSETGTGKTLAYLLPLMQRIRETENQKKEVRLIVLAPTYELAAQIKMQTSLFSQTKTALLIGGAPLKRQIEILKGKPEIVIGGPARLLELHRLKKLKLDGVMAVVLDEVDRLLSPELRDETTEFLSALKKDVQLAACSATVTKNTVDLLSAAKKGTAVETLFLPPEDVLRKRITHLAVFAERRDKIEVLRKLLAAEKPAKALVFTSRADQVANITAKLKYHNVECAALHAKNTKQERKAAIDRFRAGKCLILVTSDLGARGLDIPDITYIVQMDFPSNSDFFIHRAGRTARAGKTGTNIIIGDEYELRKYAALEKKLGFTVYPKVLYGGKLLDPPTDD
ncbi:MAG: DEAD/DEAH box helicase [Treponemataceae bacterium]|nr:DEAD/DEAH box helicase [Treponemataceae bacterium]